MTLALPANPHEVPDEDRLKEAMGQAESPEVAAQWLEMVVYGAPKNGKTHFLGTIPKILILDFDHGSSIITRKKFPNFKGKRVRITSWEDVQMWYWILATQKHPFKAVAWDTATMALDMALQAVLAEQVEKNPRKSAYKAERDDYGRAARVMRTWITMYRGLPMHKLWVCHARDDDMPDEDTGDDVVSWKVPDLQGSVRTFLLGLVSLIGYSYRIRKEGKIHHLMAFDKKGTIAADRYGVMPKRIVNPTWDKVMEKYQEVLSSGDSSS